MRRLLALLLLALPASAQVAITSAPCKMTDGSCAGGGGSVPTPTVADDGKVISVNSSGAYTLTAVTGTGTVTSVTLTVPSIFAVSGSPITTAGTFAVTLATQAKNLVWAGPATGADAAPTFRALVAADLGSFTLSPSFRSLTLQDATGDTTPLTVRASSGAGTAHIAQFQASDNTPLSHIAHDGKFVGDVTGTASAATAAADGLTSASGTAPLTLTLAAKGLTGSVADMGAASAGTPGTKGLVPAPAAGDQAKFLRGDATWQASAGGGVTNSAGANVLTKSDGTNLVATALSEASAGAIATSAGTALGLTATAPAATTGASQTGIGVGITASPAVASTDTAGAAVGGAVTITAGAAARNTSGNANGGDIVLVGGAGIGTGVEGGILIGSAGTGKIWPAGNGIIVGTNAVQRIYLGGTNMQSANGVFLLSTGAFGISSSSTTPSATTPDVLLYRKGTGAAAWGVPAASPVAYTHTLAADSRAGTDTNVRGAKAALTPGIGTGTGGSGDFVLQTAPPAATGTTANTPADRIVLASKPVTLTESSATPVLDVAVASGTVAGGTVWYTIRADDATDFQSLRGQVQWSAVNKGGTLTAAIGLVGTEVAAVSAGTLTNTPTITTGTNSITINLNAVSSLTQTTLYAFVSAEIDGTGVATTK